MNHLNKINLDRQEILRILSLYHSIEYQQMVRFFPDIPENILTSLLRRFEKQGRLVCRENLICSHPDTLPDKSISAAIDILLDFYPDVAYHAPSEYPVVLTFLTQKEGYDIIYIPEGKEILISHTLSMQPKNPEPNQRLAVIESKTQLKTTATLIDAASYCLISNGQIQYFKKQ